MIGKYRLDFTDQEMEKHQPSDRSFLFFMTIPLIWLVFRNEQSIDFFLIVQWFFATFAASESFNLYQYINYYNDKCIFYEERFKSFYYNQPDIIDKTRTYHLDRVSWFIILLIIDLHIYFGFLWNGVWTWKGISEWFYKFVLFLSTVIFKILSNFEIENLAEIRKKVFEFLLSDFPDLGFVFFCLILFQVLARVKIYFKRREKYIDYAIEFQGLNPEKP